jgi:hypothetical protein
MTLELCVWYFFCKTDVDSVRASWYLFGEVLNGHSIAFSLFCVDFTNSFEERGKPGRGWFAGLVLFLIFCT